MVAFTEIAGKKLDAEQTAYLDGLFAGMRNRGLSFGDIAPDPVTAPTPVEDKKLIFEERVKRDLHPLDSYESLMEDAASNRAPAKENIFRYKWQGLFFLSPVHDAFMCRLRIPGGEVNSYQLRGLARLSSELTTGYIQITTRANFQLRNIEVKNAPALLAGVQALGLHSRGSGGDNIRNITCNPTAGFDPDELIDTMPLARELGYYLINHREFYDLPRKFNIAFDGGGRISSVEDTNDIGLRAVEVADDSDGVAPGVYFRVALGGATGHKAFARDLGVLVRPGEAIAVIGALVRVFIANGNRNGRKKARLKHLLETWTLEQYLGETEKLLGRKLLRALLDESGCSPLEVQRTVEEIPHSHVGVYQQEQSGLNYVGVAVPVGEMTPRQLEQLAEVADEHGSGEVRLTVWQNLVIPNVPDDKVELVKKRLVKIGFGWQQSFLANGFVACTGKKFCKFAGSDTKGHAKELIKYLGKRVELDQPINIHLTGCPHSCAQHYMGDIGLLGAKVKVEGESVEGYHVFVGGGFGTKQKLGRQVFKGISFESLKPTLERMLLGYLKNRRDAETFLEFTSRHDVGELQGIFSNGE